MDNYNIRQDRPRLSSEEIAQRKDFDSLLNDYHIIKKPFYKNPWFFGVTGMATVGLLIGTTYSFTDSPPQSRSESATVTNIPPKKEKKTIYLASLETPMELKETEAPKEKKEIKLKKKEIHDNNSTLKNTPIIETETVKPVVPEKKTPVKRRLNSVNEERSSNTALQNHPRINGKIGGELSLTETRSGTSIVTDSNIPIVGFEMHLATEFGFKVYRSNSNTLTTEMVKAIKTVGENNEVYFEQIKGQISADKTIGLQPLKYMLTQ